MTRRRPPVLLVHIELEELPVVRLFCDTAEDEARLRSWLGRPPARRRLLDALEDVLNELAREATP